MSCSYLRYFLGLNRCAGIDHLPLKGVCHEIFRFKFFSWISVPCKFSETEQIQWNGCKFSETDANSAKRCKFSKVDANSAKRMQIQRNGCEFSVSNANSGKRMQIQGNGCKFSEEEQILQSECEFSETDANSAKRMQIQRNGCKFSSKDRARAWSDRRRAGHQPHFSARSSSNHQFHSPAPRDRGAGRGSFQPGYNLGGGSGYGGVLAGAISHLPCSLKTWREICHSNVPCVLPSTSSVILYISFYTVKNILNCSLVRCWCAAAWCLIKRRRSVPWTPDYPIRAVSLDSISWPYKRMGRRMPF